MTPPPEVPHADGPTPRRRAAARPVLWRAISVLVALIVTPIAAGMMLTGATIGDRALQTGAPADGTAVILVIVGAALVGAVACTAFWSSIGVAVEGALMLLAGLIGLFAPADLLRSNPFADGEWTEQLLAWVRAGTPLLIGGLFLVVGGVASVARRRMTRGPAVPLVR